MSMQKTGFLKEQLERIVAEQGPLWPGGRLPTVRTLARELLTSQVTVIKVLRLLTAEGRIEIVPGRDGYFVPGRNGGESGPRAVTPVRARHAEIARALRDELVSGIYPIGELIPTLKEIRNRFSCGYSSVRAAIHELQEQGFLEARGRGYVHRVPGRSSPARSRVCFAATPAVMWSYQWNTHHFIRAVETDIERLGWEPLRYLLSSDPLHDRGTPTDRQPVSAYVFFSFHHSLAQWQRYFEYDPDIPVIIVDPSGSVDIDALPRRRYFGISCDNIQAGRNMGATLAGLGHRRVAYISHAPADGVWTWAESRAEGLASVFPLRGSHDGSLLTIHRAGPQAPMSEALAGAAGHLGRLQSVLRRAGRSPEGMLHEGFSGVYEHVNAEREALRLEATFEEVLADNEVTAWVCANDTVGALAQSFLSRKQIAIPGRLSLSAFDSSSLSRRLSLTTYDFGYDRMGHIAVQYLLRPSAFKGPRRRRVQVAGQVIVRDSIGPPRNR